MNAITETGAVSFQTLEHVLGTGDLSKLTTQQRVEFYAKTCQSLGLNPLTRPFRFMSFQGNTVMYATRDCTDQLRKVHAITLHIVDKQIDGDLFVVTVRARTKDGREDEDMAAVTLGQLRGEARANGLMKAMTKAKRRVTLSICGLGLTDESELDTLPGAQAFDHEQPPPAPSTPRVERATAVYTARPPRKTAEAPGDDIPDWVMPPADGPEYPFATAKGGSVYRSASEWTERWRRLVDACVLTGAPDKLQKAAEMNAGAIAAVAEHDPAAAQEVREMLEAALNPRAEATEAAEPEMSLP